MIQIRHDKIIVKFKASFDLVYIKEHPISLTPMYSNLYEINF